MSSISQHVRSETGRLKTEQHDFRRTLYGLLEDLKDASVKLETERKSDELPCNESDLKKINQLQETMEECAMQYICMEMQSAAVVQHLTSIERNENPDVATELTLEMVKGISKPPVDKSQWRKNQKYKTYMRAAWQIAEGDKPLPWEEDDDIIVSSGERSTTCPLSGGVMERPMRNQCGHSYERDAIFAHLRNGPTACPVAGCSKRVSRDTLEEDVELEAYIKHMSRRRDTKEKTGQLLDLESDDDQFD